MVSEIGKPTQADLARQALSDLQLCDDVGEADGDATPEEHAERAAETRAALRAWVRRHEQQRLRADAAESQLALLEGRVRQAQEHGIHI